MTLLTVGKEELNVTFKIINYKFKIIKIQILKQNIFSPNAELNINY